MGEEGFEKAKSDSPDKKFNDLGGCGKKYNFKKVGENVKWFEHTLFIKPENITILDNSQIDDFVFVNGGIETIIENNVHIAAFCSIIGGGELIMGSFSGLSAGCRLVTGSDDFEGGSLTNPTVPIDFKNSRKGKIEIGKHALIGSNTVILPDTKIGEGAIVSAGSIVNKDLEPWSIYVGYNPRKTGIRDKHKILTLELEYYKKYFDNDMLKKYGERIKELQTLLKA